MKNIINNTYQIIDVIGKGGMSTVYKAEHIRLKTIWAVKEVSKNQKAKFDFLAEANILKKLDHPMLPKIVDIFEDDDYLYVVEDYVEGEDLEEILKRQIKFDEQTSLVWFKQIAECLGYLHSQKPNPIIYRDMKPSNIMVQPDGSLKIIDFGIAREYKEESLSDTTFIGTKGYAAPEQAGKSQSDARTDIYSLGVTMYHILTGKSPYEPPYSFVPIRQLNPDLSIGIEIIIDRCVKQEPEDRYSNTQELIDDLDHIYKYDREYGKLQTKQKRRKLQLAIMYTVSFFMILSGCIVNAQDSNSELNSLLIDAEKIVESNPDVSLKYANDILNIDPNNNDAKILKATAYFNMENYQECIDFILNDLFIVENLKNDKTIVKLLADAYCLTYDYENSIKYYETLITDSEADNSELMRSYMEVLIYHKDIDKAVEIFNAFYGNDSSYKPISYDNGLLLYIDKNYEAAEEQFNIVLNNPNSLDNEIKVAAYMMCWMYSEQATNNPEFEWDKEIDFIEQLVQDKGMNSDPKLWDTLSDAYFNKALSAETKESNQNGNSNAHQHNWIETSRVNATCSDDGKIVYTCECGLSKTMTINKLSGTQCSSSEPAESTHIHNWYEARRRNSTCSSEGTIVYKCDCGEVKSESIPKLSGDACATPELHVHNWIETSRNEATCSNSGTIYYSCSCGQTKTETIPQLSGDACAPKTVTKYLYYTFYNDNISPLGYKYCCPLSEYKGVSYPHYDEKIVDSPESPSKDVSEVNGAAIYYFGTGLSYYYGGEIQVPVN